MGLSHNIYVGPYLQIKGADDLWEILEDLGERLSIFNQEYGPDDYDLVTPNVDWGVGRETYLDRNWCGEMLMSGARIGKEKEEFARFFFTDILNLQNRCGSVILEWGILGEII